MLDATVRFAVPGPPMPKERARVVLRRDRAHASTPKRTASWERTVATYALEARQRAPAWSLAARYAVEIHAYRAGRFDLDNVIKSAHDGCTGILWKDDAQVVEIHAHREEGDGEGERLVMMVAPVSA